MRSAEWKSGLSDFHSAIRISSFTSLPLPAGCNDHSDNDQPGDHESNARTYPESIKHREQEDEEKPGSPQARHIGPSAAYGGAPDHHQRDRGKEIFVANLQRRSPEIAGQQCSAFDSSPSSKRPP